MASQSGFVKANHFDLHRTKIVDRGDTLAMICCFVGLAVARCMNDAFFIGQIDHGVVVTA
jgi:hypothetical protein